MEKVKISISGHDFYLKSEDPNRMYETAENLQKRIDKLRAMAASMSLTKNVMLAALDIADENYDNRNVVIKAQQLSQEIQAKSLACEKRAEELEKQLSDSDTELASLRITASEAQSELAALKEQLAGAEAQKSDLLALRSENDRLKEQVTALTAEKDSLTEIGADEIEQLGTRIDELTAENTALSEKAENADNALKNENAQLKNQVDELKAENETLRASNENADSSSAENEALKSRLAELTEKNRHTEELLEKLRTDHENLVSKSGQDELLLAQIDKQQGTVDTYEKTFDEYAILWVKDLNSRIDFVNGFTESYGDPLGMKASWESLVNFKDLEATHRTEMISSNAQWFEDHSPVDPRFRKDQVKGVSAKVITAAILAGDLYPATAIGINLPNANWIRAHHGSKSVTIGNITDAYNKAAHGNGFNEEFVYSDAEIALIDRYSDLTD